MAQQLHSGGYGPLYVLQKCCSLFKMPRPFLYRDTADILFVSTVRCFLLILSVILPALLSTAGYAKGVYLEEKDFISKHFAGDIPEVKTIWLRGDVKKTLESIFGRQSIGLRQRYWQSGETTAWIFNEIGKELPITIGVVVANGAIQAINVLEYRESRGGEVRHLFFTAQFEGLVLGKNKRLDGKINGITGATLSVRAMERVATAALFLHQQVKANKAN